MQAIIRILSKSSLGSSSSTGKSLTQSEEVSKLQREIELLKQTIDSLKVSVDSRDAAIGAIAREKEKLYVELKSAQRTNRNLHQQLVDERHIHSKEKEFFINEIKRNPPESSYMINVSPNVKREDRFMCSLNDLKSKDEVIYNIGTKYLKIKSVKMSLHKKLKKLQEENQQTYNGILTSLTENQRNLDKLLDNLIKCSTMPPNSKQYLKLLQLNADLQHENTKLKMNFAFQKELNKTIVNHPKFNGNSTLEPSNKKLNGSNGIVCDKVRGIRHLSTHSNLYPTGRKKISHYNYGLSFQDKVGRPLSDSCLVKSLKRL